MLHGNTACRHVPQVSGLRCSASAYGQARTKLPLDRFGRLWTRLCTAVPPHVADDGRWHGHRTFRVAGSGGSRPEPPALQDAFGPSTGPRPGCGVPVARRLGLFHAGTGLLMQLVVAPLCPQDLAHVQQVPPP
jgi:hypothetical protein